jgi:NAD(P)-dependent dehydrogenase (short-subunit alcohol dehydrogenase family)
MTTVLITGANRGLGLEFARQYAEAGWRVLAACRDPDRAGELGALAERHSALTIHRLDVARFEEIDALAAELAAEPVDVLLNNAGVYGDSAGNRFGTLSYTEWERVLRINVLSPAKMAEEFRPQLQRGSRKLIVSITSLMGSIADNSSGGSILYRSSKAALNAAMKSIAIDLRDAGIGVLLLHPGWVQTDMGGPGAPTPPAESISGMRRVIESFTHDESGRFVDFRGNQLPW